MHAIEHAWWLICIPEPATLNNTRKKKLRARMHFPGFFSLQVCIKLKTVNRFLHVISACIARFMHDDMRFLIRVSKCGSCLNEGVDVDSEARRMPCLANSVDARGAKCVPSWKIDVL